MNFWEKIWALLPNPHAEYLLLRTKSFTLRRGKSLARRTFEPTPGDENPSFPPYPRRHRKSWWKNTAVQKTSVHGRRAVAALSACVASSCRRCRRKFSDLFPLVNNSSIPSYIAWLDSDNLSYVHYTCDLTTTYDHPRTQYFLNLSN